ncbi:MAG: DNA recombination protein RmuC [Alphaproteobacteria bacterium]|nr:DNA recombination protein RmuC [Alphaproteobacteria bacterium]
MQNLNNFVLDNLGFIIVIISTVILCGFGVLFFRKDKSDLKDLFLQSQGELTGRIASLNESNLQEQSRLLAALNEQKTAILKIVDERLLAVTKNVGEGLQQNTAKTNQTLTDLRERLAKIDAAQQKISSLSEQVVSLQEVLSNKQARGAFGEIQLNDLVSSILSPNAYDFQVILSNGKRADCLLKLPNPPGAIVIDAKFPLESYYALRQADNDREKIEAERFFRASVLKHIRDISDKYIVTGETAESALMFLPSEAIYAELHANFIDVVEASYKAKVWIVSPTTLMATLNTVRAILKDVHMKEQAGLIQKEVGLLLEDISRLDERVENLQKHFKQANDDIESIKTSSNKVSRRVKKIEEIEMGEDTTPALPDLTANS